MIELTGHPTDEFVALFVQCLARTVRTTIRFLDEASGGQASDEKIEEVVAEIINGLDEIAPADEADKSRLMISSAQAICQMILAERLSGYAARSESGAHPSEPIR
ncbi:hypothetical protein [Acuticoccus sediminis]|uniref:hypothetical protein n=1 Tax=Acuticoccus sediminis TaxID=2184697 RepID=UPI001CFC476A|nr:hypothetical protein [Acuticoccus sediminis]